VQDVSTIRAAYEGMEDPASFATPAALAGYREALLARTEDPAALMASGPAAEGPVLEVGSGNGRLLIALARYGLREGDGIDLSRSRTAFARTWAGDLGLRGLRFEAADALTMPLPRARYAAAVCITGALGYFAPAATGNDQRLVERLGEALRPGGELWLEVYPHASTRRVLAASGGTLRRWSELPEPDPWRFYLSDLRLNPRGPTLLHRKTFVARVGGAIDTGREEELRLFDAASLTQLLEAAGGFGAPELLADWRGTPYDGGDLLILRARRA
jgi:SAM-dependent methyltransferase